MIKKKLEEDLKRAAESLGLKVRDTFLSISPSPSFGDYSSNIALQQAKESSDVSRQSSEEIANEILSNLSNLSYLKRVEVKAPGFINFFIKDEVFKEELAEIIKMGDDYGKNNLGGGKMVLVEFISANPTGPLTLANGRGGALGDTLTRVLEYSGYKVDREYYVNDTGNQIRILGESVLAVLGKAPVKEEHYKGGYIKELAEKFQSQAGEDPLKLGYLLAEYLLEHEIKPPIAKLGIKFDEFYSERSVYEQGLIAKTVELLEEKDLAYEKEGAVWFKATQFGDEKDRVLLTSEAGRGKVEPTYFLADIAHHLDNLKRGYLKRINLLGADHHGYGVRMKGVMEALGFKDRVEIIFFQFVRLFRDGKEVRMSKRAGTFVALDELLEAVGKDVVRFFFLMYAPSSHIDFDLDLAKEKSNKNPVFYVQYAYARMANIINKIKDQRSKIKNVEGKEADISLLKEGEEIGLIKAMAGFPEVVEGVAKDFQVQKLTTYALKLAEAVHNFYEGVSVLEAGSKELKEARLALVKAAKQVLGSTLNLMGIEAVEKM